MRIQDEVGGSKKTYRRPVSSIFSAFVMRRSLWTRRRSLWTRRRSLWTRRRSRRLKGNKKLLDEIASSLTEGWV
jgi:hypothetical protein